VRDLTQGSITSHLLGMAMFIGVSMLVQTAYFVVDLYFVSRLGNEAIAGVSAAGNVFFLALAASQLVSIGVMALVSQSVGAKDEAAANLYSDQAISMSLLFALVLLGLGYLFGDEGIRAVTANEAVAGQGIAYLHAYLPALALMFPVGAMVSALRGTGVVGPTMVLQTVTVVLNAVLAPVLIAGWGTGMALGVAGAGWASTIAAIIGTIALLIIFPRVQKYLRFHVSRLAPDFAAWRRLIFIGLPTSLEFGMMFLIIVVLYWIIRPFGPEAQAGVGVGARIMQMIFLPAMAVAFAAAPIAGQNFGARRYDRVRETFRAAAFIGSIVMISLSLLCHIRPDLLARVFIEDPAALAIAGQYLQIASWAFVFNGLIMTSSSMFQAMGDTRPSFIASASRLLTFAAPAIWMSQQPWIALTHYWFLSITSIVLQCAFSLWLLFRFFRTKLGAEAPAAIAAAAD
jgi:putative MATE family efflux protein